MIQIVPFLANVALAAAAAAAIEVRQTAATQVAKISSVENVAVRPNGLILATNSTYDVHVPNMRHSLRATVIFSEQR